MLFTRQAVPFPGPWKRRFAVIPILVGVRDGRKVYAWFRFYESRTVNHLCYERRSLRAGDSPVIVDYGDLADA